MPPETAAETPAEEPRSQQPGGPGRALVIPLAAIAAVVVLVAMSMIWPVDGQVVTAAVVGILTLAAVLAGHAAGSGQRRL
jgi:anti-sigma factor RsiW